MWCEENGFKSLSKQNFNKKVKLEMVGWVIKPSSISIINNLGEKTYITQNVWRKEVL